MIIGARAKAMVKPALAAWAGTLVLLLQVRYENSR